MIEETSASDAPPKSTGGRRPRKIVLLGDFGVGKTSFGRRLAHGDFSTTTQATLGVAHFACEVAGSYNPLAAAVKLEVWDTAGQERYRSLDTLRMYLRRAAGAVVVFDVTRGESFESAKHVILQLRQDSDGTLDVESDMPIALACNKADLRTRDVDMAAVHEFARAQGVVCARETSCKTGAGVVDLASALASALPEETGAAANRVGGLSMPRDCSCNDSRAMGNCC